MNNFREDGCIDHSLNLFSSAWRKSRGKEAKQRQISYHIIIISIALTVTFYHSSSFNSVNSAYIIIIKPAVILEIIIIYHLYHIISHILSLICTQQRIYTSSDIGDRPTCLLAYILLRIFQHPIVV